ncbi:MAG: elongation factor G [Deltaproteobacteria bacterium]|nr:elongation factor G [Deltaproteobacteria bacterium]
MKNVGIEKTRNFALIGHAGDGKTSLGEALLHKAGVVHSLGAVDQGSSVLNCLPEERDGHTHSISTHTYVFDFEGAHLTLVDTPGDPNFRGDGEIALQAMDGSVLVVSAVDGLRAGGDEMLRLAEQAHLPVIAFINGLDREQADFEKTLDTLDQLDRKPVVAAMPVGIHADLQGVIDLVQMEFISTSGSKEIPDDVLEEATERREALIEAAAEWDDRLLEKYLEGEELSIGEIQRGLARGMIAGKIVPVLCGSALSEVGVDLMLHDLIDLLPSPVDHTDWHGVTLEGRVTEEGETVHVEPDPNASFSALVFKTIVDRYAGTLSVMRIVSGTLKPDSELYDVTTGKTVRVGKIYSLQSNKHEEVPEAGPGDVVAAPKLKDVHTGNVLTSPGGKVPLHELEIPRGVISYAIQVHSKKHEEKAFEALSRIVEEDPSLHLDREPETGEFLLAGMGELHLRTTVEKLHRIFGVDIRLKVPKVPYRETITTSVKHVEGKLKKQSGGAGMFAVAFIDLEPMPRGEGFVFEDKVVGGAIPRGLIPAVEKGALEACAKGPLAGYPLVDVKVRCVEGKYHSVDSNEMAFRLAGSFALRAAAVKARPILLEPFMLVEITIPEAYVGDIMGDLSSRRGMVLSTEVDQQRTIIEAKVPMSEMLEYALTLTSISAGMGTFCMEFSHYNEVPAKLVKKIVDAKPAD